MPDALSRLELISDMRLLLLPLIVIIVLNAGIDLYIYKALSQRCRSRRPAVIQAVAASLLLVYIIVTLCLPRRSGDDTTLVTIMWLLFGYVSVYIPKYLFVVIDLLASVPRLWHRKRLKPVSVAGAVASVLCFAGLWWSALVTRNSIHVNEVTIDIPGLPEAFDGYRIVQFSDAHVGTYGTDTAFVSRAVDRMNALGADLIVFTGDIVNRRTDELEPHATPLSRLTAPDGVLAILGNHDYGDYSEWPSATDKTDNMKRLYALNRRMGWRLLLDETVMLHRGGDSIAVIGVENIGDAPFPAYGSLERAYPGSLSDSVAKILLSHNPAHWSDSIADMPGANVALTLSGHTHAMQCELFGWSPAKYRYRLWGGLYRSRGGRQLYVNIGLGAVGMPVRIGQAVPEITSITLKRQPTQ